MGLNIKYDYERGGKLEVLEPGCTRVDVSRGEPFFILSDKVYDLLKSNNLIKQEYVSVDECSFSRLIRSDENIVYGLDSELRNIAKSKNTGEMVRLEIIL